MVIIILEYKLSVVYEPSRTHVIMNVLSRLLDSSKPLGILDQILDAGSEKLLRDRSYVINSKLSSKTEVGQK